MKRIIEEKLKDNLKIKEIFERIFEIYEYDLKLNDHRARELFPNLVEQKITIVKDKILEKETVFNISRAKRPIPQEKEEISDEYDPFCNGDSKTIKDEIGFLENNSAKIVANISKMAPYHSVLYFKKHDFDDLNENDFVLAIDLASKWFEEIKNKFQTKTEILIWNFHYRAAASILHPHFQLLAYYHNLNLIESLKNKFEKYKSNYQSDYLEDYFYLMKFLGLGKEFGNFKIWLNLTPRKEKEINFYGILNERNSRILWQTIFLLTKSGTETFNLFYIFENDLFKNLGFFVDRGPKNKKISDFGTLEVFSHSVVSYNPFEFAKIIFQ